MIWRALRLVARQISLRQRLAKLLFLKISTLILYFYFRNRGSKSFAGDIKFLIHQLIQLQIQTCFANFCFLWNHAKHMKHVFVLLYRQIDKDCELLEQEGIMDYSLLLGIHFKNISQDGDVIPLVSLTPTGNFLILHVVMCMRMRACSYFNNLVRTFLFFNRRWIRERRNSMYSSRRHRSTSFRSFKVRWENQRSNARDLLCMSA